MNQEKGYVSVFDDTEGDLRDRRSKRRNEYAPGWLMTVNAQRARPPRNCG